MLRSGKRGKLHPAMTAATSSATDFACDSLPASATMPSLVVFDLDATLWTPELYQLRKLPGYKDASGPGPVANKDVKLFDGAKGALREVASAERWKGCKVAVASRTNKGPWAKSLLKQFEVDDGSGRSLDALIDFKEIFTGDKTRHFESLREKTGIAYEDMLFFDDAKGGRYGNCEPVARMGVMSVHTPEGLTSEVWKNAVEAFAAAKAAGGGDRMGKVVDAPASAVDTAPQPATIATWKEDKAFGFVRLDAGGKEVFFHKSSLAPGVFANPGAQVIVSVGMGKNGKPACVSVEAAEGSAGASDQACVSIDCFSMNQPFAGLVAHGFKTLETRNSTVFQKLAGRWCCLHVGQRTYPDGGKHREIMQRPGGVSDEAELNRLTSLPPGFSKGHVVAILEIGETELMEAQGDREAAAIELGAVATGAAMGRYLTTVRSAHWLAPPGLQMKGFPGVSTIQLPVDLLPADLRDRVRR